MVSRLWENVRRQDALPKFKLALSQKVTQKGPSKSSRWKAGRPGWLLSGSIHFEISFNETIRSSSLVNLPRSHTRSQKDMATERFA